MNESYANVKSAQAMKQQSVIEEELDMLRKRVSTVNSITRTIADKLWMPAPEGKNSEASLPCCTVAEHIRDIHSNLDIAFERLETIAKCLQGQLGDLKLEN